MIYTPHAYQQYASDFISNNPVCALLLEMGMGKSVITLTAINELMFDYFSVSSVLVIAPLRVARHTWSAEIEKWSHLDFKYSVVVGTQRQRIDALNAKADIYIINRENVCWLESQHKHFDMLVIDELSSFKSYTSKRFKSLMRMRPKFSRALGLTGTPASNGLMDLFAEFKILDMGKRLGRFIGQYRENYFLPDKQNGQIVYSYKPRAFAREQIYERISDITISMQACEYLSMPKLICTNTYVELNEKQTKAYERFKADLVLTLDDTDITSANAAVLCGKLAQMASGAVYADDESTLCIHDKKLEALEDIIEAANGKPVLIAYWFKHDLERIKKRFCVRELKTDADINDWCNKSIDVALIHPASAGHGLNLQSGGCLLVWFSLTWSLELYQQTCARLYRQGQKDTCVITHIITRGTIDEQILQALQNKEEGQASLIQALRVNLSLTTNLQGEIR